MIERCKCGSSVVTCHQTFPFNRWRVECMKNHFGPWHDTRLAAVRAWNKKRRARKAKGQEGQRIVRGMRALMASWCPPAMRFALLSYCFLSACCGPSEAERVTCRVVGDEYLRYVDVDAALSTDQQQDRHDLIDAWRLRVNR